MTPGPLSGSALKIKHHHCHGILRRNNWIKLTLWLKLYRRNLKRFRWVLSTVLNVLASSVIICCANARNASLFLESCELDHGSTSHEYWPVTHSDLLTHLTRDPLTHCHLCLFDEWRLSHGRLPHQTDRLEPCVRRTCRLLPTPSVAVYYKYVMSLECDYGWISLQCFDRVGWAGIRHPACKKTEWWGAGMVICLERGAGLHTAQLMPLPLTVSCFQIGFYLSGTG